MHFPKVIKSELSLSETESNLPVVARLRLSRSHLAFTLAHPLLSLQVRQLPRGLRMPHPKEICVRLFSATRAVQGLLLL
jgi:hypothetical protein